LTSSGSNIYAISPSGVSVLLHKLPLMVRANIATVDTENQILYFAVVANPNRIAQLHLSNGKLSSFPINVTLCGLQFGHGQLWALGAEYQGNNLSVMRVDSVSGALSRIIKVADYDPSVTKVRQKTSNNNGMKENKEAVEKEFTHFSFHSVGSQVGRTAFSHEDIFYLIYDGNLIGVNTNTLVISKNAPILGISTQTIEAVQWSKNRIEDIIFYSS
jgi:hypothetical protein